MDLGGRLKNLCAEVEAAGYGQETYCQATQRVCRGAGPGAFLEEDDGLVGEGAEGGEGAEDAHRHEGAQFRGGGDALEVAEGEAEGEGAEGVDGEGAPGEAVAGPGVDPGAEGVAGRRAEGTAEGDVEHYHLITYLCCGQIQPMQKPPAGPGPRGGVISGREGRGFGELHRQRYPIIITTGAWRDKVRCGSGRARFVPPRVVVRGDVR